MNAENSLKLARRFIELPPEKRRVFLAGLQAEGVDFSVFPIPADVARDDRDGLSYAQRRMAFLWQLDPQGAAYNLPMAVRLRGVLDTRALQQAFDRLVARHESLRTCLRVEGEQLWQEVMACAEVAIVEHDLSAQDPVQRETRVAALAEAEAQAPFDLSQGPLLRVRLLKLAADEHVLLLTLHHIVADGWSLNVLIDEFVRLYDAACQHTEAALPPLPIQYRDYALWQRSWLEAGEQDRQLDYWRNKLGDDHSPLDLPLDRPRGGKPSYHGARHEMHIEAALAERLRTLASAQGMTLFMVLLASFKLLLQRYSGQRAIRVGVPVANRHRTEVEGLIGCFINTQVLHTDIDPMLDVSQLLSRIKDTALGAQAHQDLPFERLVEALELDRSGAHSPLFQVLFNHQAAIADAGQIRLGSGLTLEKVALDKHSARFDLALDTYESAGRLHAVFTYALDVFEDATIARLGQHWLRLLEGLTQPSTGLVGELPLALQACPPAEHRGTAVEAHLGIHDLIEAAASREPQRLAAVCENGRISYATLCSRSDALAQVLLDRGVQADQRVGVLADRTSEMLVGILAVLKAGAAYLPLDPEQPRARLDFMLADSHVHWVLGRAGQVSLPQGVALIDLESDYPPVALRKARVHADNLAYVIYTSGTTGQPKGVAVSHGALVNYVRGVTQRLPMDEIHSLAMVTTPAADLGHTMLFGALCSGKTLHLLPKASVLDAEAFATYLQAHAIDALKIVPSHVQAMLAEGARALPRRCLVIGGEACTVALLGRIKTLAPALSVINHYGPTETTVGVLTHALEDQPLLGRPLDNLRAYTLDGCLQPVPGTARGELYIAGAGLARGYLGQAELTAERFVPDPHGAHGTRMYRTGDWVRQNRDGERVFAGRIDGQVKIRGYRVELAEIESCLRTLPGIDSGVVRLLGEEANRQLVAYLAPQHWPVEEDARQAVVDSLRATLKQTLPEHMVPHYLMLLERLPVTANGKVDRKALPEPVAATARYRAPETPLQRQVAAIWADVLQVPQVGLDDNFFALGGHSLLATQVVSRIRQQLHLEVALRLLFDTLDLAGFTQALQAQDKVEGGEFQVLDRNEPMPVSHAQYRQWMFWKLNPDSTAYNTPLAVKIRGVLDLAAVQAAVDALIGRHETLRTIFVEQDGVPWQRIRPAQPATIEFIDLGVASPAQVTRQLDASFSCPLDLARGPLIRVSLFKTGEDEHLLAVLLHHIVSDGWSMSVMVRELASSYNALVRGQSLAAPDLAIQYADYAAWQRQRLAEGQLQAQLSYWKTRLEDDFSVLELPADRLRPQVQSHRGGRIDVRLPAELTASLRRLAVEANATLFHVFLASFALLLSRYSGRDTLNIGIPVTNRNRLELEGLIGFFVNTVIARLGVNPAQTFSQLLASVKETTLQAQANKDLPFDVLVESLKPDRGLGHNPLFQVMFNHLLDLGERVSHDSVQGLHVEEVHWIERTTQFDLSLDTLERSDGVTASFNYASDLFDEDRIQRLAGHWLTLLHGLGQSRVAVAQLPLLDSRQHRQLVETCNPAPRPVADLQCTVQLFEQQAAWRPEATALVLDEQKLTYGELNRRANRLAHQLREWGVGPEVRVGIAMERSLELIVGLLGILKAGGAYVPLDPEYPHDRLTHMVLDSGIRLLLTEPHIKPRLPATEGLECLERMADEQGLAAFDESDPVPITAPANLAYVIYTSGSTGMPKGVAIARGELSTFCQVAADYSRLTPEDKVLQFATVSFDGFVEQLYPALCRGAQVVMRGRDLWDIETLTDTLLRQGVTVADLPTAYWRLFAAHMRGVSSCGSLRQVHVGGEAMPPEGLNDWFASSLKQVRLLNTYGPTEATVVATVFDCTSIEHEQVTKASVPIGRAIGGRATYLCDNGLSLAPVGQVCELLIGGRGCLARGYFNRPALTAERFIPDPFDTSEEGGGRLYRTGDLASYRVDGVLEYSGRIDHQVKVRGFRVELGEIEARLLEHASVREAVVLAQPTPSGAQLVGYVVPVDAQAVADVEAQRALRETLRSALKNDLPDHMVPAHLLLLVKLPLSPNGKLDRRALPQADARLLQHAYVAPKTLLQQQVATIWAQVLQLDKVGLDDHFFELGGHSLLATRMISRLRQALGIDVSLRSVFEAPVLADFVEQATQGGTKGIGAIERVPRSQPLTLSYGQQRLWFLWQLDRLSAAYHIPAVLHLQGALNVEALRQSFQALIARHEPLRTTFLQDGDHARQVIHDYLELDWELETLETADSDEAGARVEEEVLRPFDLEHGPLLRVRLLRRASDEHVLVLTQHHIVSDGWSIPIMVDELVQLYESHREGRASTLPALQIQYADYARWQRSWMDNGERDRQLAYWQTQLGGEQPVLQLPIDRPRPAVQSHAGARHCLVLDEALAQRLATFARGQEATLFMVLLASLQALLHRYSGQADIRLGVPVANRTHWQTERLIGFFVNTQVMKAEFDSRTTFATLLQQVKQAALGAQMHQDLPFEQLVEALQPERTQSHSPLFQVMFNHQALIQREPRSLPGLTLRDWPREQRTSQFDLTFDTAEADGTLQASITYSTALFDGSTIERLGRHWVHLLESIVTQPQRRVAELPLLRAHEQRQIIEQWNGPHVDYAQDLCLHQLIERQVQRTPQATALSFGTERLSYDALNRRANRLAHRLRQLGVGPDVLVGVALERSFEMVVGLLAILKAGGAYVPLDPEYPQDRLTYMLKDSGVRLLLTQPHLQVPIMPGVHCLDVGGGERAWSDYDDADLVNEAVALNLAYVIYTSGSTGRPKGTQLTHHNVVRLFQATREGFAFDADDVWTVFHSYAFDFSVWELFGALLHGARAVIVPKDIARSPEEFHALLVREQVTVLNQTPSAFKQLIPIACQAGMTDRLALRYVVFGGEALDVGSLAPWFQRFGDNRPHLINMYGITETTVHVTYRPLSKQDVRRSIASPLGTVIADLSWYLLDHDFELTLQGCHGELHVGQAGLARGYLNRPGLTAERFVPDPFDSHGKGGGRLYRTGDLAHYRADGVIEYTARIDHQVKVRGFRIELGEIEACLRGQSTVHEAVVLAHEGASGAQLVAYIVPADSTILHTAQLQAAARDTLRGALKSALADYMVPAHLMFVDKLALTPNGKLDRKALPRPEASQLQQGYSAPHDGLEERVAAVWADVLKLERVGRDDNFFDLGGHSLLATQVVARVRQRLASTLELRDLFDHPRLADFVARITPAVQDCARHGVALRAWPGKRTAPLALVQRRLWVVEQLSPGTAAYGMPMAVRLRGELSINLLQASLQSLIRRHEVLRTTYGQDEEGEPIALILPQLTLDLPFTDLSEMSRAEQAVQIAALALENETHPFVLEQAPLLRMQVARLGPQEHVLFYSMHHIISDGWSMAVLANELVEVYGRLRAGHTTPLPELALQYSDFALWQQELQRTGLLEKQAAYWKSALGGYSGYLPLPVRRPRPTQPSHAGGCVSFALTRATSEGLAALAAQAQVTLYTVMLAVFQAFLHRIARTQDVVVGVDFAGRQQAELEGLIGFFVNVLPLRSQQAPGESFTTLLGKCRDQLLTAFEHQDLPFDMIVEAVQAPRHKGISPLVQVLFVMNNVPLGSRGIEGLSVEPLPSLSEQSKFDIALFIEQGQDQGVSGQWRYACALFEEAEIQTFVDGWVGMLEQIVKDPGIKMKDMNMPMENAQAPTPMPPGAGSKSNKLDKFLKKSQVRTTTETLRPIRESLLVPTQDFPLVLEPTDPDLDAVRWIEANRPYLEEKLARHGGILFRGFSIRDSQAFEAFAEAVQPGLYGNYGDLPKQEGGQNTYRSTPYPEKKMILFHNESAHQDSWPRKQLFFCEQPSPVGGATPVVDCRQMYLRLPETLRHTFERKGLLYVRTFTGKLDVSWQHFFKTQSRDEVEARCRASGIDWRWLADDELQIRTPCPAIITHPLTGARSFFNQVQLHHIHCLDADVREDLLAMFGIERMPRNVYYGDGSPIEDEVMSLIGALYEQCAVRFDWRKGDVILLDNMLVAHARDPFEGPRKIVVAMGDMVDRSSLAAPCMSLSKPTAETSA
ncbi:amino acid adenylation domain-containing protein [Pseudomonas capeferrum]|uniref:non-ribosomal peptide synthetase n=1 Tax=Pseudomonas capeferrum TaxID=1495066 RepID=UPI0015E368BC|nr:non-ribosomal peptide synthetase [Pseudomonas capeferrum]MBA1200986.1 amino acid adenylation domain-containing protein [Pseudomonas capeferrum]